MKRWVAQVVDDATSSGDSWAVSTVVDSLHSTQVQTWHLLAGVVLGSPQPR
jgi:hypothetical protein